MVYITYLAFRKPQIGIIATSVTITGFVSQTLAILMRWREFYEIGRMGILRAAPFTNLYESLVFFVWCLILAYLVIEFRYKNKSFGAFVTPVAGLALAFIDLTGMNKEIQPLVPALQSNWLTIHVTTCFFGYASFAVSFGISILYLIRDREGGEPAGVSRWLPSAPILDEINYKSIVIGFPMLTLGIVTGAAWANYAWGTYWSWDPKETWSLITWFIYAAFLHARLTRDWRGRKTAILSIIGFLAVLFTYFGVNYLLSGLHSYL